jgi:hypothetical protein
MLALLISAMAGTTAALASGKPGSGCSPGFQGPIDVDTFLSLPKTQAGLEAGFGTVDSATAFFNSIDHNGDGLVCWQDPNGYDHSAVASNHQYEYNLVDNNASTPTG